MKDVLIRLDVADYFQGCLLMVSFDRYLEEASFTNKYEPQNTIATPVVRSETRGYLKLKYQ